jgi:hypothetical protein
MTITHRASGTPLYKLWEAMKRRCYNPRQPRYMDYGGRGITVCEEWRESFVAFRDWALANGWSPSLQLDREDNSKGYSPANCRFVTRLVNCRNKRSTRFLTAFGETKSAPDWADDERCVVSYDTLMCRIDKYQWDAERALVSPVGLEGRANVKLTLEKARAIRARYSSGETAIALASEFGLTRAYVYTILSGECWPDPDLVT